MREAGASELRLCVEHGWTPHARRAGRSDFSRCRVCTVNAVSKRRRAVRAALIATRGSKCEKCGYSKCKTALEFHHPDDNKELKLSGATPSLKRCLVEAAKCTLLCANCHREAHEEERLGFRSPKF